jgi:hypothetical protein
VLEATAKQQRGVQRGLGSTTQRSHAQNCTERRKLRPALFATSLHSPGASRAHGGPRRLAARVAKRAERRGFGAG